MELRMQMLHIFLQLIAICMQVTLKSHMVLSNLKYYVEKKIVDESIHTYLSE